MNRYKKLFSNTIILTIGQMSSKLLSFLLIPLYTSVLSTEEYGSYDLILTSVTLLTPILTLVVSEAVLRFCVDSKYDNTQILSIGLATVFIGTVILIALYPIGIKIQTLSEYYWWVVILFFAINIHTVLMQYLKGVGKVKEYAIMGVVSTLITLLGNIAFLLIFKWKIIGYFLATTLSHLILVIIIVIHNRLWRGISSITSIPKQVCKDVFRYSIPMMPNSISWWISNSSDKYMLQYFISAAAVGVYSVGYKIPTMLSLFVSLFISAFQLSIFEDFDSEASVKFFNEVYRIVASLLVVLASCLVFGSRYLATILYQNDFYSAWRVGCILIMAFVFNSLCSIMGTIYSASKNTKFLFYSTMSAAFINIIGNLILIPRWGIYGAAIATLISYACVWGIRVIHLRELYSINLVPLTTVIMFILLIVQAILEIKCDDGFSILSLLLSCTIIFVSFYSLKNTGLFKTMVAKIFHKEK